MGDPTELALLDLARQLGADVSARARDAARRAVFHFDPHSKRMSTIDVEDDGMLAVHTKGAPETVLPCCSDILCGGREVPLTEEWHRVVTSAATGYAATGLRLLAIATGRRAASESRTECRVTPVRQKVWDSVVGSRGGELVNEQGGLVGPFNAFVHAPDVGRRLSSLGRVLRFQTLRWNEADKWIYSNEIVHPPIIDDQRFQQAQQLLAAKSARHVVRRPRTSPRAYMLRGVLFCGICNRRMQGTWNNGQPYYRCAFPSEYARTNQIHHPRTVYLREIEVVPKLETWLTRALDPAQLPATIEDLAAARPDELCPEIAGLRDEIAQCERQLAQYRAALDGGGDPAVVGQWITETQARKLATETRLRAQTGTQARPGRMSKEEIDAMVNAITDLMTVLRSADPADKAELYARLGLR